MEGAVKTRLVVSMCRSFGGDPRLYVARDLTDAQERVRAYAKERDLVVADGDEPVDPDGGEVEKIAEECGAWGFSVARGDGPVCRVWTADSAE